MILNRLQLDQFRNLAPLDWEPCARTNLLLGANAQGKTNLLEGVALLATTRSFRAAGDAELVAHGKPAALARATVTREATGAVRDLEVAVQVEGPKRLKLNGKPVRKSSELFGQLTVVLFTPADLMLVQSGPAARRGWLDLVLCQGSGAYLIQLQRYQHALKQRNAALKRVAEGAASRSLVESFDPALLDSGAELLRARARAVLELAPLASAVQAQVSGGAEALGLACASTVAPHADAPSPDDAAAWRALYAKALSATAREESARGLTVAGPHRDDLALTLSGRPARAFASQGQQRTVALALKLAEVAYLRGKLGEHPVLLLDDVLSELDGRRQQALLALLDESVQTFLTSTHAEALPFEPGQVRKMEAGVLV